MQGLAVASGRPCVGLSTLDVMALSAAGSSGTIVALVDAFRGEVYSGVYDAMGVLLGAPGVVYFRTKYRIAGFVDILPGGHSKAYWDDEARRNRPTSQFNVYVLERKEE